MWLETCDDGADDSDGEHPEIHQVERVTFNSDHTNGTDQPDENECCRERKNRGESVIVRLHRAAEQNRLLSTEPMANVSLSPLHYQPTAYAARRGSAPAAKVPKLVFFSMAWMLPSE